MNWKNEYKIFLWILGFFLFAYFMPIENETFSAAIIRAFDLAKWYAQEHVLLCLIPAFFIAGVIAVFVSQNAVEHLCQRLGDRVCGKNKTVEYIRNTIDNGSISWFGVEVGGVGGGTGVPPPYAGFAWGTGTGDIARLLNDKRNSSGRIRRSGLGFDIV